MPRDPTVSNHEPERIDYGDSPTYRIENRNHRINGMLDEAMRRLETLLEGPKSEHLDEQEKIMAQRIVNRGGVEDAMMKQQVAMKGSEIPEMEADNYNDYWQLVDQRLEDQLEEDSEAAYFLAGHDWTPGVEVTGNWRYIGLGYEQDTKEVAGEQIGLVNQDIHEFDVPQITDEALDLAVIKAPGVGSTDHDDSEIATDIAYQKLREGEVLLSDREYEGEFENQGTVTPTPRAYLNNRVDDQYGESEAYNVDHLKVLVK
jgi:hypothetical protein